MHTRRHRLAAVATTLALLFAVGCGGDDDATADADGTTTTADAYCDAVLAIETAGEPDVDFQTATEEEMAAAIQTFASEVMTPLVADALAVAPEEIRADGEKVQAALEQITETGDPSGFEDPEVAEANDRLHAFDLANCGWNAVTVTTHDYRFEGLDDELPAGVTSFEMENHGEDVHELALIKRLDGVDDPVEDLLELPDEEVFEKVEFLGIAEPVPNGASSYLVADLTPGDYIAICFIPVGATSLDGPPPEGPPHFLSGMVTEFTVS